MRFVQLYKRKKAPFKSIIYYKCGPRFVAKRQAVFEFMLQQQNFIFWFRFWLTFSCYPVYIELSVIQDQWPELITNLNLDIYKQFLKVTHIDRYKFCVDVIASLRSPIPDINKIENLKGQSTKQLFECFNEILHEYWQMSFAIALCDVFYKWLLSSDMHDKKSQRYWIIPHKYLECDYQPSSLEEFLADEWKEKLYKLLGVAEKKIPWYQQLVRTNKELRPVQVIKSKRADKSKYIEYIQLITEVMVTQKSKIQLDKC